MGDTKGIRRSNDTNDKRAFFGIALFHPVRRV